MKKTKQFRPTAFILNAKMKVSLMLLLMLMLVPQGAWALGGSGTSGDPFTIANENDLFEFADRVNNRTYGDKCFKLVANITLTKAWTPIGTSSNPYTGTFDGQGHKISGLSISGYTKTYQGFFGYVNNATIQNFSLEGSMSSSTQFTGDNDASGTVVGRANGSTKILNVVSSVNLTISTNKQNHIGGIVGYITGSTQVSGCTYSGTLDAGPSVDSNGGIVGFAYASCSGSITNCFFNGTIKTTGSNPQMGGILGYTNDESNNFGGVQNCYSCGTLTFNGNDDYANAIVGRIRAKSHTTINNTFLSGTATRAANTNCEEKVDFTKNKAITISVTAGANGTVSQTYVNPTTSAATQLQVEATPNAHYHFGSWSDSKAQTHNVGLTDNVSLSASFAIDQHTISVATNNSNMGTVSGGGTFDYGTTNVEITATPKTHYHFEQWNDGNTNASRTITVTGDETYTATFAIDQHTITVQANNNNYGTVTGSGTYNYGTQQTITATPKNHYHFVQWSDGNTNASRQITVNGNATYTATFAIDQHTITVQANNNNYGTVSGGGTFDYNSQQTITATPKEHYHFVQWSDNNTNASRTITVNGNATYTATFAIDQHTITVQANNNNYGTVSGGGTFDYNSSKTITATPKTGYHFVEWNDGNTDASRTITITGNKIYTATFAPNQYTITVATNNSDYGTVSGGGTFDYGSTKTITATPKTGYHFVKWSDDNTNASRTITVNGHATYTAVFAKHTYGEWITDVEATCTTDGTKHRVCTHDGCNADDVVTIPACHQWGDDHTCTVCGHAAEIAHTGTSGTCTWAIYEDGLMIVEPTEGETGTLEKWGDWVSAVPWNNYKDDIISVQFRGKVIAQRCEYMFYSCKNLRTIDFENFDTKNETSMYAMFSGCISLQSLDLSSFNTASVTDMSSMFNSCSSLQSLDLSSFNTASVTNMSSMFNFCPSLQSLDLSNFNTSSVADMSYMFSDCSSLQSLDLSNFNTSSVTEMSSMFHGCEELAVLKLSNDFVIETECQTTYMFYDCGISVMNGKIYYVLNGTTQNKIKSSNTACNYMDIVSSAIVKDGVPFKMSQSANVPGKDVVVTRQFAAQKPASVMLPFTVNDASQISGATFYEFKGVRYENNEWLATMQDVSTVAAYKPYVVIREGAGDITFGTGSQTVSFPVTPAASSMTTTDPETGWTFQALNESKRWEEGDEEIGKAYGFAGKNKDYDDYSVAQGDFVKIAAGASAKPGRCYLIKDDGQPLVANAKGMTRAAAAEELPATIKVRFVNGDDITGIAELNTETGEMSAVQWYDLNGRKIEKPTKGGIYIKNNKKVMVK